MKINFRKLEKIRYDKWLSITEWVAFLGITRTLFYTIKYDIGERKQETVNKIAKALELKPEYIVDFD